jgi:hypothetical protein
MREDSIHKKYYTIEDCERAYIKYTNVGAIPVSCKGAPNWSRGIPEIFKLAYAARCQETFFNNYKNSESTLYIVGPNTKERFEMHDEEGLNTLLNTMALPFLEEMFDLKVRYRRPK